MSTPTLSVIFIALASCLTLVMQAGCANADLMQQALCNSKSQTSRAECFAVGGADPAGPSVHRCAWQQFCFPLLACPYATPTACNNAQYCKFNTGKNACEVTFDHPCASVTDNSTCASMGCSWFTFCNENTDYQCDVARASMADACNADRFVFMCFHVDRLWFCS